MYKYDAHNHVDFCVMYICANTASGHKKTGGTFRTSLKLSLHILFYLSQSSTDSLIQPPCSASPHPGLSDKRCRLLLLHSQTMLGLVWRRGA